MTMHIAVRLSDDARRVIYEPLLARHGIVHWCGNSAALESVAGDGAAVVILEPGDSGDPDAPGTIAGLRKQHPALLLVVSYNPGGEELAEAARLTQRSLRLWFDCEAGGELDLLLTKAEAGQVPAVPSPAELAARCVADLSLGRAARRFAWFCGLTPSGHLDEAATAARCGEKLRTVQRQFADAGVSTEAVRRAFQTLHAAWWLREDTRNTDGIADVFGRRSGRALRDGVKEVFGRGVRELRRLETEDIGQEVVKQLRNVIPTRRARAR